MTHPVDIDALLESLPASGEYVAHAGTPVLWAEWWFDGEWRSVWRSSPEGRPLPPEDNMSRGHWRSSHARCLQVVADDVAAARSRKRFTGTPQPTRTP